MVWLVYSWFIFHLCIGSIYDTLTLYLSLYTLVYKEENKKVNPHLLINVTLSVADYRKCL